jgi:hypothetical protein
MQAPRGRRNTLDAAGGESGTYPLRRRNRREERVLSVRIMQQVFELSGVTGNDRVVLLVLADHAHDDGAGAYPSQKVIGAKAGGIGERTVRDCLGRLEEAGHIGRLRKRGRSVEYAITIAAEAAGISEQQEMDTGGSAQETGGPPPVPKNRQEPLKDSGSPPTPPQSPVERVKAHYLRTFPRKRLGPDDVAILRKALSVAEEAEVLTVIDACAASDYHQKRGAHRQRKGGKYNAVGKIFKPRPSKGETWRSRIEWWLEKREEQQGGAEKGSGKYAAAARAKSARAGRNNPGQDERRDR